MHSAIPNFIYLAYPLINILVLAYQAINFLHIPFALGFSIIILTIIIRLVLYPFTASQLKATKKMQELNPHLSKLKDKHKNDAKTLQAETMKLYKEHGVNPAAGCLPVIIQLPLIYALYQVLYDIVKYDISQVNNTLYSFVPRLTKPWDTYFFGLPLAQTPSHLLSTLGPIVLMIPILTVIFQLIQSKMMIAPAPQGDKAKPVHKEKKEDFATAFQTQSLYIFPLMIGFFSYGFPIGLSLYWNTFTIFGIIQQYRVTGIGGLRDWVNRINFKK
ncbi:YidC/Oxa1 family membrane protein insertase [Patescibacteria group bacterium]|nr:YidC/Oxa1 family membrane protein insertase [Patescibacteria group bacterium]